MPLPVLLALLKLLALLVLLALRLRLLLLFQTQQSTCLRTVQRCHRRNSAAADERPHRRRRHFQWRREALQPIGQETHDEETVDLHFFPRHLLFCQSLKRWSESGPATPSKVSRSCLLHSHAHSKTLGCQICHLHPTALTPFSAASKVDTSAESCQSSRVSPPFDFGTWSELLLQLPVLPPANPAVGARRKFNLTSSYFINNHSML